MNSNARNRLKCDKIFRKDETVKKWILRNWSWWHLKIFASLALALQFLIELTNVNPECWKGVGAKWVVTGLTSTYRLAWVLALAWVVVLCFWARYFTLPLSSQECEWVLANCWATWRNALNNLWWTNIPSREKWQYCLPLQATETRVNSREAMSQIRLRGFLWTVPRDLRFMY